MVRKAWVMIRALALAALVVGEAGAAKPGKGEAGPEVLEVPHEAPAYFYPPRVKGKNKPVVVWLHGRSGNPEADCRKWAKVVTEMGWLVCPSGPEDRGGGQRGWNNSWPLAKRTVDATMDAFHERFARQVKPRDHLLIGFSEGAYAAMNIGVREPEVFSRWLILAASDVYWGGEGAEELKKNRGKFKRIYLLTGAKDGVAENTKRVHETITKEAIPVRLWIPSDIGHEVPPDRMRTFYRKPLQWLLGSGKK
jgi:predicted esterase